MSLEFKRQGVCFTTRGKNYDALDLLTCPDGLGHLHNFDRPTTGIRIPPPAPKNVEHNDQSSTEKLRSIPASHNSRTMYGIERWLVATDRRSDQLRYFIEATPVDSRLQPTSITVEIHGHDGITVAVQRDGRLRSITHKPAEIGEASTLLTTPDDRQIAFQGTNKSDRPIRASELSTFRAIIGVASRATELRDSIDDVALDLPSTLVETLDSSSSEINSGQKRLECFIPAATIGAVAAAIQNNLGPSGLVTCAAACATTVGCIYMSVLSTTPTCWGAATGCAGCGAVGLGDVMANCSNMFWQEK
jgi:hypothetical protein